jgi:predicted PurR-regulated permease PerM
MTTSSEPAAALPERAAGVIKPEPAGGKTLPPRAGYAVNAPAGEPVASSAWDAGTKRTVVLLLLIVLIGVLWISRPIIPLLVIAMVIAYFLSPVVDLAERLRIPRTISTIVLYMLLLVALILTPVLLAPILVNQLASLNFDVPSTAYRLIAWIGDTVSHLPSTLDVFGFQIELSRLTQQFQANSQGLIFIPTLAEILSYFQQLISTATNLVSSTAAIGFSVVGSIVQVFVTFLVIFFLSLYLTKDAPSIRAYIESLVPPSYQSEWVDLLRRMGTIWQGFFRGQILLSTIIGVTTWVALELAGMPGALILGILAGSLEIVPTLGPVLAGIPAVIVALIQGSTVLAAYGINNFGFALITVAIYFIIQQLENNILVPRIIGGGVNLHPVVVICAVAVGYNLFGILGALFAAPVVASLRVLGAYIHAKLLDYPPFEGQSASRRPRGPVVYRRTVTGEELAVRAAARAAEAEAASASGRAGGAPAPPADEDGRRPASRDGLGSAAGQPADVARQEVGTGGPHTVDPAE